MRENRTHGSEGGEGTPFPTPISGLGCFVIPAKAGIQEPCREGSRPDLLRRYEKSINQDKEQFLTLVEDPAWREPLNLSTLEPGTHNSWNTLSNTAYPTPDRGFPALLGVEPRSRSGVFKIGGRKKALGKCHPGGLLSERYIGSKGRFVKRDAVSLEAAVFRLCGVPLRLSRGLWADEGPFYLINKRKNVRISRKTFDMIIADVKMMRRISKVFVVGCVVQTPDGFSMRVLPMKTVFQWVGEIPRVPDVQKNFEYAPFCESRFDSQFSIIRGNIPASDLIRENCR